MRDVSWLPTAEDDLAGIISYIAERSPQAARNLRQRIDLAVRSLVRHPCRYRVGRVVGTRELVVHVNYVVVYRVTGRGKRSSISCMPAANIPRIDGKERPAGPTERRGRGRGVGHAPSRRAPSGVDKTSLISKS
ncbi:type II toxin-antitoxin system RelE/ParE family toxin [Achromobacter xylosoxidans]|uniref:type II toxin-antitoxin system RelE/ParE family toxin n=1 Tax=Alcaligenes xylosoxydans xylosoxydans TaxID=85698 RepID=UPI001CEC54D6|nr:type II toxin-antitoxin system RelE/ParE family toxin [Achromobacter xylosoxidans]